MLVASVGRLPGTLPPMSVMWPNIAAQAISRPARNTGTMTSWSLMWLTAPSQLYGSFSRMTSPSSMLPLYWRRKPSMNEPNWPTTMRPWRSAISGKASPCSRMPGDSAVRNSVASISTRALRSAFSMMSRVTGSTAAAGSGVVLLSMMRAGMVASGQTGLIRMLPKPSTVPAQSARITVVASISVTMAGPAITSPARSRARS